MSGKALLELRHISKHFAGSQALSDVSMILNQGEVLGLVGANGAGKSTLMNILGGVITKDAGSILIDGREMSLSNPTAADKAGIAFVHQEPALFSMLTVAENMFVAAYPGKWGWIDRNKMIKACIRHLRTVDSQLEPNALARDLGIGDSQLIEIARALSQQARIVLFDEPTSSLTVREKERLFQIIQSLKKNGTGVIYISHFLDEVLNVCDRVIVLRNGQVITESSTSEMSMTHLVEEMLGRRLESNGQSERQAGDVVLQVKSLSRYGVLRDVSFVLHKNEVVGLWGLLGAGRSELFRALTGLDPIDRGQIWMWIGDGLKLVSPVDFLSRIGYVTENRRDDGLFAKMSLRTNISAASLWNVIRSRLRLIDRGRERRIGEEVIQSLTIKASGPEALAETLSGGNQQKMILGKWLQRKPAVILLDEPTRGVDVGAKAEIHRLIGELANQGTSIFIATSEIEELISLSDRVLVISRGHIIADITRDQVEQESLMRFAMGEV